MTEVDVLVTNRWARIQSWYPEELSKFFSYRAPGAYFSPAFRNHSWDGRSRFIQRKKLSAGLFLAHYKEVAEKLDISFNITWSRVKPEFRRIKDSKRLYQVECNEAMLKASKCGGVILCATGTGKTHIAGDYFKQLKGSGVFVVDEITLLKQTQLELSKVLGEDVGQIGQSVFDPKRISVATVQTLHLHRKDRTFKQWRKNVIVAFLDEVHLALNKRNIGVMSEFSNMLAVFGLTATLQVGRKEKLMKAEQLCGPIIYRYPLKQGVAEKYLAPGVVVAIDIMRRSALNYKYQQMYTDMIVDGKMWNRVISNLVDEGVNRGHSIIVIVDRIAHVRKLRDTFKESGHMTRTAYGKIKTASRQRAIVLLEEGRCDVIVTNRVFQKGVNIKRLSVIIDGTSGANPDNALQKYGRGVRQHEQKDGLFYFDIGYKGFEFKHRFEKAAKRRRSAYRKAGVSVSKLVWEQGSAKLAYRLAEKQLEKEIDKL